MNTKNFLHDVMLLSWQFVRRNGYSMSEALKTAWVNMKLIRKMRNGIIRFYFRKVDGSIREAWGSLNENIIPTPNGNDSRKKNVTIQPYWDSERQEWRCYKKANLLSI